ncbi:aromatic ring-hydroxylating oxygenase subunit alpha [Aureitalea marina]|uniref:Choline monooxygenase n=1 Tax=Aureitalea marina TaxID=930804 RepID=A0A2S7KTA4_9FLAO|nr:aromatic ring-hydroxylating dioxygenase subunit alpha [Aureitalea marina]PQB05847.1 choline monooxygenase [Aureitalea marina]
MGKRFHIDTDIRKAETLPASFYRDEQIFTELKDKVFLKSWHWLGDITVLSGNRTVYPLELLPGFLSEPLVLTRNKSHQIQLLSNVCTHRGNKVVLEAGKPKKLICGYHGRRFDLEGKFEYMPEFEQAEDFPRPCDHLPNLPLQQWGPWLFGSLDRTANFQEVINELEQRVGFLPLEDFRFAPTLSKDYLVHAHWALYCDNYLEGFHIPFVHDGLMAALDYGKYKTVMFEQGNLQIGYAQDATEVFDLPEGHPDHGEDIGAYYYWIFPNIMLNFYPWGLSVNVVKPLGMDRTKVSFLTYVLDPSKLEVGAGASLEKVEREDEFVVENVQKGVRSSLYQAGRYSPTREQGVHQFHRLLSKALNG